ncbi:MAG: hypothetical protein GY711_16065 [bacterium]|nr:hypothetical protein [bacterium]
MRFDFGDVTPGRIKLGLHPVRESWVVDLPETGARQVRLDCGSLARVEVEVCDAESGERLPIEGLAWSPWPPGTWQRSVRPPGWLLGMEVARPDATSRVATFLAPAGTLHFGFWHEGYGEDGREERIEAVGHDGESELLRQETGRYVLTVTEGGAWRVVSAPGGWVLASDGDVRLVAGERTEVDLEVRAE